MATESRPQRLTGFVEGNVRTALRLEGLLMLLGSAYGYHALGGSGWTFAILFLAPDLAFIAIVFGAKASSIAYNVAHTTSVPIAGLIAAHMMNFASATPFLLIWLAHIGFDRAVGYGLKYATGFDHTHLGLMGQAKRLQTGKPA